MQNAMKVTNYPPARPDCATIHEAPAGWYVELAGHASVIEAAILIRAAEWRVEDIGEGRLRFHPKQPRPLMTREALEEIMRRGLNRPPSLVLVRGGHE